MEINITTGLLTRQVNCTCEHNWHKHANGNVVNAESLLKNITEKLNHHNDPQLKQLVDNWIAEFSTRTGSYKVFDREKGIVGAGGRVTESVGYVSYL